MQPSLAELLEMNKVKPTCEGCHNDADCDEVCNPVYTSPAVAFDHKACILCDHVIVQQVLGNKCKLSGALCCYMRSCPEEDRKKREAVSVPAEKEEIPCCENCINKDNDWCKKLGRVLLWHERSIIADVGCLANPRARAYLNKSVIETLELELSDTEERFDDNYSRGIRATKKKMIALLRGDDK
jgi:hypothetical protein